MKIEMDEAQVCVCIDGLVTLLNTCYEEDDERYLEINWIKDLANTLRKHVGLEEEHDCSARQHSRWTEVQAR
jgi:hypothetical protein